MAARPDRRCCLQIKINLFYYYRQLELYLTMENELAIMIGAPQCPATISDVGRLKQGEEPPRRGVGVVTLPSPQDFTHLDPRRVGGPRKGTAEDRTRSVEPSKMILSVIAAARQSTCGSTQE